MAAIHLIERLGKVQRVDKDANEWESGHWVLAEATARRLVGGQIYLHDGQERPSRFGGDIVSYRVQGSYALPVAEEGDLVQHPPSFWVNSVAGFTVGVVPPPTDQSPPSLGVRLRSLLLRVCNLGWITSDGVCRSLQVKLDQATQSIAGNRPSARGQLRAFLDELEAQHGTEPGKHVTDSAYGLLKINAQYLLSGL